MPATKRSKTTEKSTTAGQNAKAGVVVDLAVELAKPPKQERSRQSFERALDAAAELLVERGSDSFTLAEVAQRAGGSIGSIYGRVESKDNLIRAVHARELERIDAETNAAFAGISATQDLTGAVASVVHVTGAVLRSNAPLLAPFMLRANTDPVLAETSKVSIDNLVHQFTDVLMRHASEITHPDPAKAVRWSYTVVYSVLARHLGLGSSLESAGEGDWDEMLANLAEMTVSFLTTTRQVTTIRPTRRAGRPVSSGESRRSAR